ncbi:MAG: Crp/Fnr family transcriptional regulator [bacterium]|nr:Crp/Fnr family transcriptional regulator [bacterium]
MMDLCVTLYVQEHCRFSEIARERVRAALLGFEHVALMIRDVSLARRDGFSVTAVPTLLLPNGTRVTGTPSLARLQKVLAEALGKQPPMANKVWYLERNRVFHGVPREEIEKYAHLFREQDYRPKEIVFSEGDLGDAIYLLKSGHVRLFRSTDDGKELTLAILGPGDVFGELALFKQTHRQTFAEAVDAAHICAASVEDFTDLMGHRPELTMMVATEMAKRRQDVETRIAGLAYGSIKLRLLHALRHLAREHGEALDGGEVRIPIRLSHQELAQLIGTSRETCTLELGKLQMAGAVRVGDDRCFVVHPERLEPNVIERLVSRVFQKK